MERKLRSLVIVAMAVAFLALTATAEPVTFKFDPTDFFNYKAPTGTIDVTGGMFKLHETWGGNVYRSWVSGQHDIVDNFAAGLGADEGICTFNIWLADQSNAPLWGETLVSSGSYMPTGTAPDGWTATTIGNPWPDGENGSWLVEWSTTDPDKYIRPGNNVGDFGFTFLPTTPVTSGESYTIWFGGVNFDTDASLVFDASGGFASQMVTADYGSGFEATLSLQPVVPEPVTMLTGFLAVSGFGYYMRKHGRKSKAQAK